MKKNKKIWSYALAAALAVSNLSAVAIPITAFAATKTKATANDDNGDGAIKSKSPMDINGDVKQGDSVDITNGGNGYYFCLTESGDVPVVREYTKNVASASQTVGAITATFKDDDEITITAGSGAKIGDTARLYVAETTADIENSGNTNKKHEYIDFTVKPAADGFAKQLTVTASPTTLDPKSFVTLTAVKNLSETQSGNLNGFDDYIEWTLDDNTNFEIKSSNALTAVLGTKSGANVSEGQTVIAKATYYNSEGKKIAATTSAGTTITVGAATQDFALTIDKNESGVKTDVTNGTIDFAGTGSVDLIANVDTEGYTSSTYIWSEVSDPNNLVALGSTSTKGTKATISAGTGEATLQFKVTGSKDGLNYESIATVTLNITPTAVGTTDISFNPTTTKKNPLKIKAGSKETVKATVSTTVSNVAKTEYAWTITSAGTYAELLNATTDTVTIVGKTVGEEDLDLTVTLKDSNGTVLDTENAAVYVAIEADEVPASIERTTLYLDDTDQNTAQITLYSDSTKKDELPASAYTGYTFTPTTGTIATVDATGLVTAKGVGSAKISVENNTTHNVSEFTVNVVNKDGVRATSVELDKSKVELNGKTLTPDQIVAIVKPVNTADKTKAAEIGGVSVVSDDEDIVLAEIANPTTPDNDDGSNETTIILTPVHAGKTSVTVSSLDPLSTAKPVKCEVEVSGIVAITIAADKTELNIGETATITKDVEAYGSESDSVTWKSSDTSVATISDGVVTAVAGGKTIITATSIAGTPTSNEIEITVKSAEETALEEAIAEANAAADKAVAEPTEANIQAAKDAVAAAEKAGATAEQLKSANDKIAEAEAAKQAADDAAAKEAAKQAAIEAANTAAEAAKADPTADKIQAAKDAIAAAVAAGAEADDLTAANTALKAAEDA
ncbi:Ig-like domain-containing protein, partial [Butyrivibrio sp. LC3010]|uniref:Ig-like domain-containing protein n=1 Tax=Butyrivibrio sp. LC3010 TaxID=1280680 RepID=UPI0018CB2FB1